MTEKKGIDPAQDLIYQVFLTAGLVWAALAVWMGWPQFLSVAVASGWATAFALFHAADLHEEWWRFVALGGGE